MKWAKDIIYDMYFSMENSEERNLSLLIFATKCLKIKDDESRNYLGLKMLSYFLQK